MKWLQGGTAGAPEELNNGNLEEPRNYWEDTSQCQYYVGLQPLGEQPAKGIFALTVASCTMLQDVKLTW